MKLSEISSLMWTQPYSEFHRYSLAHETKSQMRKQFMEEKIMSINADISNNIRSFLSTCRDWTKPDKNAFQTALSKMLDLFKYIDKNIAQKIVDIVGDEMQEMNIFESIETWNEFLNGIESSFSKEGYLEDLTETEIESTTSLEMNIVETSKKEQKRIEEPFLETIIKIGTKKGVYIDRVYTMSVKFGKNSFQLYTGTKQELSNILYLIEIVMGQRKKITMTLALTKKVEMRITSMKAYHIVKEDGSVDISTELSKNHSKKSKIYEYAAMTLELRYEKKVDKNSKYFLSIIVPIEIIEQSIKKAKMQLKNLK